MEDSNLDQSSSQEAYSAIRTIIELTRCFDLLDDVMSRHFARFGLSQPKFNALMQLRNAGECGLSLSELGERMLVSRANITGLIDRLERDDLVIREVDSRDRRVFRARLTNKSLHLIKHILPLHGEFTREVMSGLTGEEKENLSSLLQKLSRSLQEK